jgi:hypothetical protein
MKVSGIKNHSIAIASFSLGPAVRQPAIIRGLEFIASALGQLLGENIDAIIKGRGTVTGFTLVKSDLARLNRWRTPPPRQT